MRHSWNAQYGTVTGTGVAGSENSHRGFQDWKASSPLGTPASALLTFVTQKGIAIVWYSLFDLHPSFYPEGLTRSPQLDEASSIVLKHHGME